MSNNINQRLLWQIAILGVGLSACGTNTFTAAEKKDPAEIATRSLENNKPQDAIDGLEKALSKDPANPCYLSILSSAYAQIVGIDPLTIAQTMATASGTSNSVTGLFGVVPAATSNNLKVMQHAVDLLQSIPPAQRTTADNFKLALFLLANISLVAKHYDSLSKGKLTAADLQALTPQDAITILSNVSAAQAVLASVTGQGANSAQAAAQIAQVQSAIAAQPGATPTDQLRNYLISTGNGDKAPAG